MQLLKEKSASLAGAGDRRNALLHEVEELRGLVSEAGEKASKRVAYFGEMDAGREH